MSALDFIALCGMCITLTLMASAVIAALMLLVVMLINAIHKEINK